MKKLISLALVLAMLITGAILVSCGGDSGNDSTTTTANLTTTTTKTDNETTTTATTEGGSNSPVPAEPAKIGDAAALVEFVNGINDGSIALDTNAVLTADIDMTGYADVSSWNPMYVYSGTFDGAGFTIKNFNWTFTMENSANGNMPTHDREGTYIITNTNNAMGDNSFADAGVALFVICLDGGEIKNLKLADSTLNINCSYNKNYNTYVSGLVAYAKSGTISSCELSNVNVTVPAQVNYNQGAQGYASLLLAGATGVTEISSCTVNGTLNTEANVKFNAAPVLGAYVGQEVITVKECTSSASVTVCPAENLKTDDLMWKNGEDLLGGRTGELYVDSTIEVTEN